MELLRLVQKQLIKLKEWVVRLYEEDKQRAENRMLEVIWYRTWTENENERLFRHLQQPPPPVSASRLPEEPISGNGSCVACQEGTAEMLMLDRTGIPSCRHTCLCQHCIHQLTSATCPLCREPFVNSLKLVRPEV